MQPTAQINSERLSETVVRCIFDWRTNNNPSQLERSGTEEIVLWDILVCRCLHPLSGLGGFYTFRISGIQSNRCSGIVATCWLLDYQTVLLAFACETDARHAATLDTGLVASGYPGGSRTHMSSTHFQYARAFFGYVSLEVTKGET
jgi:hypothetical protein